MHYVYVLKSSKRNIIYVGCSQNLRKRFEEHNKGLVKSTKMNIPWKLVYYEAYPSKTLAFKREHALKYHAKSMIMLKKRIGLGEG